MQQQHDYTRAIIQVAGFFESDGDFKKKKELLEIVETKDLTRLRTFIRNYKQEVCYDLNDSQMVKSIVYDLNHYEEQLANIPKQLSLPL